jgi:RNA polymerase sigma-70 factor, ECF subfamily
VGILPCGARYMRDQGGPGTVSQCVDRYPGSWISDLRAVGDGSQAARMRLHELLAGIAGGEISRRGWPQAAGTGQDSRGPAAAAVALTAVTGALDSYRGESRPATWAAKFVLRELTDGAGREFWQSASWPADLAGWRDRVRYLAGPAASQALISALCQAVARDLSGQQRTVFTAATSGTLPPEALAAGLGPNRNAIYQALFEARRKITARLAAGLGELAEPAAPHQGAGPAWLDALLGADPGDTGCDLAFQAVDRYAEADLRRSGPGHRFPGIAAHLARCSPCAQDYQGLLTAIAPRPS